MPHLASISIYPVKSLEPVLLPEVRVLRSGALEGDRGFAFFDSEGKFINGKRNAKIHLLRSKYDSFTGELSLGRAETGLTTVFNADRQREEIEAWLAEFFGIPVSLRRNGEVGFPDDLDCPGPTVISTATLSEVASWFKPLDTAQLRLRIRANLEIGGVPPFWEDRLYGVKGSLVRFRIGECLVRRQQSLPALRRSAARSVYGREHSRVRQGFRQDARGKTARMGRKIAI